MPRTFVSDWKRVATSGKTADGRNIDAQDLRDMATTYDPAIYTATIWFEHIRYMGNFGSVTELKAEDLDGGNVGLFAKLAPNERLLQLNKEAQKLFTSIEISPNFADTGKSYLRGLAVTDEPASLGTEALHFSHRATRGNHFGSLEPLDDLTLSPTSDESAMSFVTRLFNQLSGKESSVPQKNETPPMDPKTAEAFATAVEKLGTVATRLEQSSASFAAQKPDQPITTEKIEPVSTPEPSPNQVGVTAEQFNSLKVAVDKLTETFNTALNQGTGQHVPHTTGVVDDKAEAVY